MKDVAELTRALVEIESTNPGLDPDGAGKGAIAGFVAEWCGKPGSRSTIYEAARGGPNVVALARGTGGGRTLLLNAHLDTVGVAGMEDPFSPRVGTAVSTAVAPRT